MKETLGLLSFQRKWENYQPHLLKISQLKQLPGWYGQRELMSTYRWVLWFQICIYYHHLTLSHFNALLQDLLKYLLLMEGNRLLGLKSWKWKLLSHVRLLVTPWTIQSMEFSRPEYWSGYPFLTPGDLSNPGIKPRSPILKADSSPAEPQGKPKNARVGSLSLLHQSFPTQELNWCFQLCRQNLSQLSYQKSP